MATSGRLTEGDVHRLEDWIGKGPKTFTLLYAITRDGCDASIFHQKCDNQGPTVTVLYNQQGSVYGGYASRSWGSNDEYLNTSDSFLFQLKYSDSPRPVKFLLKQNNYQYSMHCGKGPTFGGGHDLFTFNKTVNKTGDYFPLNGYMNVGHTYDVLGLKADQINNGTMNVTELEVYNVIDIPPWRQSQAWSEELLSELTQEFLSFKPREDVDVTEARILMLGPIGTGKSSFYNTINSVFRGRITHRACSGSAEKSLTTAYTPYTVNTDSGSSLKFRLCDTRGLEESAGISEGECNFLLEYTRILSGIPQLIVLTKIDKLCKDVESDVSQVFNSRTVEKHVEKASQLLGLPRGNVLPVKNYEREIRIDENVNILSLLALQQILNFAQDFLDNISDRNKVLRTEMEKLQVVNITN